MSDLYEYNDIDEKSKQFAISSLSENASQVNAHIESFRRWVKSMPHLSCPTDAKFLLRFLRVAKFDHKKAEKRLDNFCTVRGSIRGSPQFFNHRKISPETMEEFLNSNMLNPLGRNDAGQLIILSISKNYDPGRISLSDISTLFFMWMDILVSEEETQIHGIKFLIDLGDVSRKSLEQWSHPKYMMTMMRIFQDAYPMRLKGMIYCNESNLFDIFFTIMLFFMNEKLKDRVMRVKNDIHKAIDRNPGLEKILPTEYGGHGGSLSSIAQKQKEKFINYYKISNPLDSISVDESKRPHETSSYLAEYKEYDGETMGTEGTFTKYDDIF